MSRHFLENGRQISVSVCSYQPLVVTQIKTPDKDGYSAVQVAYGQRKNNDRATAEKLKKLKIDIKPLKFQEFELANPADVPKVGAEITPDTILKEGDLVNVAGTTKGHGFSGVIKRHGFHRGPVTGGQSDRVRAPGSIGAQTPGKVVKGKKMPGHYGHIKKTVPNLKIISVDTQLNQIIISGSVPGHYNSWVTIYKI